MANLRSFWKIIPNISEKIVINLIFSSLLNIRDCIFLLFNSKKVKQEQKSIIFAALK